MKKLLNIMLPVLLLLTFGCEDVGVIDPGLNYTQYTFVRAELKANHVFDGVHFSKTLPVNGKYDSTKAELSNITAYIKINGTQIVPLHYNGNGTYKPISNLQIQPGYTYELFAKSGDNSIYSITKVPPKPNVQSTKFVNDDYFEAQVKSSSDEVYGAAWLIYNAGVSEKIAEANVFPEVVSPPNPNISSTITVKTSDNIPSQYKSDTYKNMRYIEVFSYDKAYSKYFKTKDNNQPISDAFSQGGDQVIWNVLGSNTIGMFIGTSSSIVQISSQ